MTWIYFRYRFISWRILPEYLSEYIEDTLEDYMDMNDSYEDTVNDIFADDINKFLIKDSKVCRGKTKATVLDKLFSHDMKYTIAQLRWLMKRENIDLDIKNLDKQLINKIQNFL